MPLKLTLGRGERLIVNGAVIKNDGEAASLLFENQAQILRQKDILSQNNATTPAARVYMALQCAYLFPERQEDHLRDYRQLLDDYAAAAPSAAPIAQEIRQKVNSDHLYDGLKSCRQLLAHEQEVLAHVQ